MEHAWADVNGVRLHYVAVGGGPLIVFVHGFPEFWYMWRRQLDEFARDNQAVAPDMRGYNLSSKPDGGAAYGAPRLVQGLRAPAGGGRGSGSMRPFRGGGAEALLAENGYARLIQMFRHDLGERFTEAERAAYVEAWSQPGALTGGLNYYRA